MSIGYCRKTRRQFLLGAGSTMVALPLLPSLLPSYAMAQAAASPKRIMSFVFDHNPIQELWPLRSLATTPVGTMGVREVLLRSLTTSQLGPLLSDNRFTSLKNADQITIIRGLDQTVRYGPGHGNHAIAAAQGRSSEGGFPSFESILEQSRTLYPSTTPASVRKAIRMNFIGGGGYFFQKVGTNLQQLPSYGFDSNAYYSSIRHYTIHTLYNDVFGSLMNAPAPDATNLLKSNILNRVHGAFMSFKNNRKISSDDRARLDQHMGVLTDLQQNYNQLAQPIACGRPPEPGNYMQNGLLYMPAYLDLLTVAFKCGLTKVATLALDGYNDFIPNIRQYNSDVHACYHGDFGAVAKRHVNELTYRYYYNLIYDRFFSPMSEMEGSTGRSYLQNMVTAFLCAGTVETVSEGSGHGGYDSQQVLFGNMGGMLRSGRYYSLPMQNFNSPLYNGFLITLMHLMGVPASEYAYATPNGMGLGYYPTGSHPYSSRFYVPISEVLT